MESQAKAGIPQYEGGEEEGGAQARRDGGRGGAVRWDGEVSPAREDVRGWELRVCSPVRYGFAEARQALETTLLWGSILGRIPILPDAVWASKCDLDP